MHTKIRTIRIAALVFFGALSLAAAADEDYPMHRSLDPSLENPEAAKYKDMFNRDYYSHVPEIRNLLHTVEAYHMGPGLRKISERRYESAYSEFDFILRYYPNHPRALALMSDLCVVLDRQEDGERYFKKALKLFPDMTRSAKAKTLLEYGKLLYRFKDYDRALDVLKESAGLDGFPGEVHYYLGLAYLAEKDYTQANAHGQKAYGKKFPLTELRDKLMAANAWNPTATAKAER